MIAISQPSDAAPGTARRVAGEILRKIDSGVPFAEMAAVYFLRPRNAPKVATAAGSSAPT